METKKVADSVQERQKVIQIKNVKVCEWASKDSTAFTCSVYFNGVRVGTAEDRGFGGCVGFSFNDELFTEMNDWCKENLPTWNLTDMGYTNVPNPDERMKVDLETHISNLVIAWLEQKDMKRMLKKGTILVDDSCESGQYWINKSTNPERFYDKWESEGKKILNKMDIETACRELHKKQSRQIDWGVK